MHAHLRRVKRPRRQLSESPLMDHLDSPSQYKECDESKKFVCPYRRKFPRAQPISTTCTHPFKEITRLKEHLYRRHMSLFQCPRCYEEFNDNDGLERHQQAQIACELRQQPDLRKFPKQKQGHLRKRSDVRKSEEGRWFDLAEILFSGDQSYLSPYYDATVDVPECVSHRVPEIVRRKLEDCPYPRHIEELQEFVQDCLEELMPKCQRDRPRNYIGGNRDPPLPTAQPPSAATPHLSETTDNLTTANPNPTAYSENQYTYQLATEWPLHQGSQAPPDLLPPHSTDQLVSDSASRPANFGLGSETDYVGDDWLPQQGSQYPTAAQAWAPPSLGGPLPSLPFHGTHVANQNDAYTQEQFHNDSSGFQNFDEQYGQGFGN